jgi:hypothetical protein
MAVAMRKKRAWSTRADDAESQETAAFEASVAAAKDTAAKSGAFLSDAKSDLTDHQRWLRTQSAAVERDRQRHERWLQRQRDRRVASARKERLRLRRQLVRQRAFQAMRHALWAGMLVVSAWYVFALTALRAGIFSVGRLITRGARVAGRRIQAGASWMVAKLGVLAHRLGALVVAGSLFAASKSGTAARTAGRSLGSGLSVASAKTSALAGVTGHAASRGLAAAGKKTAAVQAAGKKGLANGFEWTMAKTAAVTPTLYVGMAKLGRQAERYARAGVAQAEGMMARAAAKTSKAAALYGPHVGGAEITSRAANDPGSSPHSSVEEPKSAAEAAEVYGPFYEGFWVKGVSPNEPRVAEAAPAPIAPPAEAKNALSWVSSWAHAASARAGASAGQMRSVAVSSAVQAKAWAAQSQAWVQTRDVDLSRMMIIAGAVLLVCGGLLVGGGLLLRAGAGTAATAAAEEESGVGIALTFQETDRPLSDRAVFTLSGTPAAFRINGLSVGGMNLSDQPLTGVEAVLKPDVKRPDLKLTLKVDTNAAPAGEGDAAPQAFQIASEATVPAGATFRLAFPFPPEAMNGEDGITVEEYFESYGGLLLKLRYEVDGTQKSLIQYLPPDELKAQLDEVSAQAGG